MKIPRLQESEYGHDSSEQQEEENIASDKKKRRATEPKRATEKAPREVGIDRQSTAVWY